MYYISYQGFINLTHSQKGYIREQIVGSRRAVLVYTRPWSSISCSHSPSHSKHEVGVDEEHGPQGTSDSKVRLLMTDHHKHLNKHHH